MEQPLRDPSGEALPVNMARLLQSIRPLDTYPFRGGDVLAGIARILKWAGLEARFYHHKSLVANERGEYGTERVERWFIAHNKALYDLDGLIETDKFYGQILTHGYMPRDKWSMDEPQSFDHTSSVGENIKAIMRQRLRDEQLLFMREELDQSTPRALANPGRARI